MKQTFDSWLIQQHENGSLQPAGYSTGKCFPFSSSCVWAKKFTGVSNGNLTSTNMLTITEYLFKAFEANILSSDVGCVRGKYQLGRIGDSGDYTVDNCRFITMEANQLEMAKNGGRSTQANKIKGTTRHKSVGELNHHFSGYFFTPYGKFASASLASKSIGISAVTIKDYCHKNTRIINKRAINKSSIMTESMMGKSLLELGWSYDLIK